jgi:epoxide hydrolase-like predicted phosphatase
MTSKIKAIIFDMGGVILRTEDYSPREAIAKKLGISEVAYEEAVFQSPSAEAATVGKINEREHWNTVWKTLKVSTDLQTTYEEAFWAGDRLDQRLVDFLRSQRGTYTTALLSNAWSGAREALTVKNPCLDAFDVAVFSCEVGLAKPDKAIYRLILEKLGLQAEEAIFLDDNKENIESAAEMGIHAVRFRNTDDAIREITELLEK